MSTLARYLEILVGGGRGDPAQELLFEALASLLLVTLFALAWHRVRRESSPRERVLIWGFGIAAFRDFSLFVLLSLDIVGYFDYRKAHDVISPFDHMLSLVSLVAISAAFIQYFLKRPALTRRFLSLSLILSIASYTAALGLEKISGVMIALPGLGPIPWYDLATHLPAAAILGWAMILLFRQRGWLRNVILAAFFFLFLHEAVFLFAAEGDTVLAGLIHSIRHSLRLIAISLLGYVYFREMSQERLEAQQSLQKALEDSENERRRTEAIMSAMGDAVSVHTPDLRILYQNEASKELMGDHAGELCYRAQAGREDICPDCPVVLSYRDGGIHLVERSSVINGVPRSLEVKASSVRDSSGRVSAGIKVIRDITEHRRAEETLRQSEENYRRLVESSPLGILVHEEGKFILANPSAASLCGAARPEDLLGMHVMQFVPDEFKPLVADRYQDLNKEPAKLPASEYQIVRLDGARVDVEMISQSFPYQGRLRVLTILKDISQRKQNELELKQAKEELEQKVEELKKLDVIKDGLLRDVSHELKTPVAKQAMQLELLRTALGDDTPDMVDKILQVMETSVRRQEKVIRNLLDLSRLESGVRRFHIRPVHIDTVMEKVADDYRPLIESAGIELSVSLQELVVNGDEEMLWPVFSNLLNNAVKFRRQGKPSRIEIQVRREGNEAVVRIIDNGIGLLPAELPRVFERFYQASATVEGSGVGLSLCKAMIEGMGATIALESEGPGKGVTATVRFPLG